MRFFDDSSVRRLDRDAVRLEGCPPDGLDAWRVRRPLSM
jgi:hypothetical protein